MIENLIHEIDLNNVNPNDFHVRCVACIIVTVDNKILLQQRGFDWQHFPGFLCTFGGHIENGETPIEALIRELHEELGAIVQESDVVSLKVYTEQCSNFADLIYSYFWHDKQGTITGCYEGESRYFQSINEIMQHPKIMEDLPYLLALCKQRKLCESVIDGL